MYDLVFDVLEGIVCREGWKEGGGGARGGEGGGRG